MNFTTSPISVYATPDEVKAFALTAGLLFSEIRKAQIYALYEVIGLRRAQICDITGYAPSTVSTMRYHMGDFAELAEAIFIELLVDAVEEIMEREISSAPVDTMYRKFKDGRTVAMEFMPGFGENLSNEQMVYFFKFFSPDGLLFDKIGTTAKNAVSRLRDEIGEYSKKFPINRVEIHRIRSCHGIPAEGYESELRAKLIANHPNAFRKNDRFFGADIPASTFDEICDNFYSLCQ